VNARRTRTRRRFVPGSPVDQGEVALEARLTMTGGLKAVGAPVQTTDYLAPQDVQLGRRVPPYLIASYARGIQFQDASTSRVTDSIDRAFDSFTSDYLQAQAAFLASSSAATTATQSAFRATTIQRVNLLAQELTQDLSRVPGILKRDKGAQSNTLQQFLARRITNQTAPSSLLRTLLATAPVPSATTGAPEATLYTLAATNAIETAHVATINAAKFAASGVFRRH
jgi:hypothetical protein